MRLFFILPNQKKTPQKIISIDII